MWTIIDGKLTQDELADVPSSPMRRPYPDALWRIDSTVNGGKLYNKLLPGIESIEMYSQQSEHYIHVYDGRCTKDADFHTNGLAMLKPISRKLRQELNGRYDIEFTIDIDDFSKYKYFCDNAIIKAPIRYHDEIIYQLMRIKSVTKTMSSTGANRLKISARHIFYDNNDKLLIDVRPTSKSGKDALDWIHSHTFNGWRPEDTRFTYSTDITAVTSAEYKNKSLTAALIGADNSFVNRWGGKLYRDNFYFSIKKEMENSRNTCSIRYAHNMTAVDFSIDSSGCFTYLIAADNFGNTHTVQDETVPNKNNPHHIYKYIKLNYEIENKEQFIADVKDYYASCRYGTVNIKVDFARLTDNDAYADILQLADTEVGDKVIVYHEELGINFGNLEVIAKESGDIDEPTVSIEIGTFKNAISREAYMSETVSTSQTSTDKLIDAVKSQVNEIAFDVYIPTPITTADGKYLTTSGGKYLIYKEDKNG